MPVKTILNRIQKHRGFVYGPVQLEEQPRGGLALTVDIYPHARNRPHCSGGSGSATEPITYKELGRESDASTGNGTLQVVWSPKRNQDREA